MTFFPAREVSFDSLQTRKFFHQLIPGWEAEASVTLRRMIVRYAMSTAFLAGSSRAFRVRTTPAWISLASFSLGRSRTLSTPASCSAATVAVDGGDSRVTRDLHPQPLWRFFEEISAIPRASKHEAAVLGYV
ncbi:unnamed protein product, partial [Ascophyllum nodosum]